MMAAMDFFVKIPTSLPKAVIIGEMSELGNISLEEHQKLANFIASQQFEKVYLVGSIFKTLAEGDESLRQWMNGNCFSSVTELCDELQKNPLKGYYILLKGSHSVHLEKAVPFL